MFGRVRAGGWSRWVDGAASRSPVETGDGLPRHARAAFLLRAQAPPAVATSCPAQAATAGLGRLAAAAELARTWRILTALPVLASILAVLTLAQHGAPLSTTCCAG